MIRLVLVFSVCLLYSQISQAQKVFGKPNVWFLQLTTVEINDKWVAGNELHARFDDYLRDPQQFLIRPFLSFHNKEELVFSGGYTFITTYPYGSYPLPENLHEHNVWEQIELKQKFGKTKILHRYRLEQRWIGNLVLNSESTDFEADGYVFRHRFRYRFTALVDLSDKWFLHFFDELFIRSGEEFKLIGFDRNWLYGGVGYKVNDRMNIQLAYLHQYIRRTANLFEQHHTIQGSMVLALGR
jgi:hypothetical protein